MSRHGKHIMQGLARAPSGTQRGVAIPTIRAVLTEQSRFGVDELRPLRAERGVGSVARIDPELRAEFTKTKRAKQ